MPFAGPRESARNLVEELLHDARTVLKDVGVSASVRTARRSAGGAGAAERIRKKTGARIVVFGRIDGDVVEAHAMRAPERSLDHLDGYTHDHTSIRVRWPLPPPARTKLEARSHDELKRCVRALAATVVAQDLIEAGSAGGRVLHDLLRVAAEGADGLAGDALDEARVMWLVEASKSDPAGAAEAIPELSRLAGPNFFRQLAQAIPLIRQSENEAVRQEALGFLRRAAEFEDDPELPVTLYNLAASLSAPTELDEAEGLLLRLAKDRTYRRAWWVFRLLGALEYGRSVAARRAGNADAARERVREAARYYSRALRLRRRARRLEDPHVAHALRRAPRSPVLHANAYDAHHFAGHPVRAWWHHRRAQEAVRKLCNRGLRAMGISDWPVAARAFELASTTEWPDQPGIQARVFGAAALMQLGASDAADQVWRQALALDRPAAMALRAELRRSREISGLDAGMPGDQIEHTPLLG